MRIYRDLHHRDLPGIGCALTIGNFDGVHRGHQAMLALLNGEARHRGLPSTVLTFDPHPREYFAQHAGKPEMSPARISTLRDKLAGLERCGVDTVILARFDERLATQPPDAFIRDVLVQALHARYVLVGDDFRFGARRAGTYPMLDEAGIRLGLEAGTDVARMHSHEVDGLRVSSSAVREALGAGDMTRAAELLGRPYGISGHIARGSKLGQGIGWRTLNLRFGHDNPAVRGIFAVRVHGLAGKPLPGVASLGAAPTVGVCGGRGSQLLKTHCLEWPLAHDAGFGRIVRVDLLHKLHNGRPCASLQALRTSLAQDAADARALLGAGR